MTSLYNNSIYQLNQYLTTILVLLLFTTTIKLETIEKWQQAEMGETHITIPQWVLRWMGISIITYRVVVAPNDE